MITFSKFMVALPIFLGFGFVAVDFFFDFEINEYHIQFLEFAIGSTVFGGVGNAAFKRFTQYKEKQAGVNNA